MRRLALFFRMSFFACHFSRVFRVSFFACFVRVFFVFFACHFVFFCVSFRALTKYQTKMNSANKASKARCSVSNCQSLARSSGKCKRHGRGYQCSISYCLSFALSGGKCRRHGGGPRCSVSDCLSAVYRGGKCTRHVGGPLCSVSDCLSGAICGYTKCHRHGGGKRCICGRLKSACFKCSTSRHLFCNSCPFFNTLSVSMKRRGQTQCNSCSLRKLKVLRIEEAWLLRFEAWGFFPSLHDKAIHQCSLNATKRVFQDLSRPDYLFLLTDREYDVLLECDENQHVGLEPLCEMSRLYNIHESICKSRGCIRKLIVVRFNPDAKDQNGLMETLWQLLSLLIRKGVDCDSTIDFPVWLFALVGYSERRLRAYKYQGLEFQDKPIFEEIVEDKPIFESIKHEFWELDYKDDKKQVCVFK